MALLFILTIGYFQPVIKYSKTKLDCQNSAKDYISNNNKAIKLNNSIVKMLSVNLCNGGNEFDKIERFKNK